MPRFEAILEKPFSLIPQRSVGTDRSGFVLGLALGAVYVPCAGLVLAAITVKENAHHEPGTVQRLLTHRPRPGAEGRVAG